MKTVTVDDQKRVRLPDANPRDVFAYDIEPNGVIMLLPVQRKVSEAFPPGSLNEFLTPDRNREQLDILNGCVQGPA